ncbi:MAG: AAA family ATPase [Zavarzinella sp.]|nr:AAA family ATPase [Zavarzinella sp.]
MANPKNANGKRTAKGVPPAERNGAERHVAYFLSLSLENVRCFGPKQTLDLSDGKGKPAPWTIILGLNGTGKTTVLQLLAGFGPGLEPASTEQTQPARYFHMTPTEMYAFQREPRREVASAVVGVTGSSLLADPPSEEGSYRLTINPEGMVFRVRLDHVGGLPVRLPWCCGYGASRRVGVAWLGGSGSGSGYYEDIDPTATLFVDQAELRNPEEWLLRLDYSAVKPSEDQAQQKARLAQAKELLLSVLPEGEIGEIRLVASGGTNPEPRAEFRTPYGWVPLRQLGYGYQTLITWVADFVSRMVERYPESPNPLAEPAVVLVDEIDLHLHPAWQRKIMGFLTERFPNTQFIATAHSPLVAQAAANANLAVLRREGDHVVIDNDVDNIRNWRVDQILTSDLFGLPTARPPWMEPLLAERVKLLSKPKLTAADERRVKEIEAEIGDAPVGETAADIRERKEIREALDLLLKERKTAR